MKITISNNTKLFGKKLSTLHKKQMPFATSVAINKTADKAAKAARILAKQTFDRPKPFLLNGIYARQGRFKFKGQLSSKRRLFAVIAPGATRSLSFGKAGRRVNQVLLKEAEGGILRPSGRMLPVPTQHMRRSKYGGLTRNAVSNLLSKANVFQLGPRDGVKPGIYQRDRSGNLKMMIAWEKTVTYRPIYRFYSVVGNTVKSHMGREYQKAMKHAIATARL